MNLAAPTTLFTSGYQTGRGRLSDPRRTPVLEEITRLLVHGIRVFAVLFHRVPTRIRGSDHRTGSRSFPRGSHPQSVVSGPRLISCGRSGRWAGSRSSVLCAPLDSRSCRVTVHLYFVIIAHASTSFYPEPDFIDLQKVPLISRAAAVYPPVSPRACRRSSAIPLWPYFSACSIPNSYAARASSRRFRRESTSPSLA